MEKISSNLILQDKKVGLLCQRPFDILTKRKALAGAVGCDMDKIKKEKRKMKHFLRHLLLDGTNEERSNNKLIYEAQLVPHSLHTSKAEKS